MNKPIRIQRKRVWKPVDLGGMRLYKVTMKFYAHPEYDEVYVVAERSPRNACKLIEDIYKDTKWSIAPPIFTGLELRCLIPSEWWRDGIPCEHERNGRLTNG